MNNAISCGLTSQGAIVCGPLIENDADTTFGAEPYRQLALGTHFLCAAPADELNALDFWALGEDAFTGESFEGSRKRTTFSDAVASFAASDRLACALTTALTVRCKNVTVVDDRNILLYELAQPFPAQVQAVALTVGGDCACILTL